MIYIRKDILSVRTHYFITGESISKDMEHIKERIADFGAFKEEAKGGLKSHVTLFRQLFLYGISIWRP